MTNDDDGIVLATTTSISGGIENNLAHISSALLRAELASRPDDEFARPECGSSSSADPYNTPLHVFALFLILFLSVFACSFPIIVRRFPRLPVPHRFLFLSRHFGTGVLIATAFVHLLPTAFNSLTDPCLPPLWNQRYPAMAGLIAMTAVLVVVGVEMFFATRGAGHSHDYSALEHDQEANRLLANTRPDMNGAFKGTGVAPRRSISGKKFRGGSIGQYDYTNGEMAPRSTKGVDGRLNHENVGAFVNQAGAALSNQKYVTDEDGHDSDLELDEIHDPDEPSKSIDPRHSNSSDTTTKRPHLHATFSEASLLPHSSTSDHAPSSSPPSSKPHQIDPHEEQKELLQCLLLEAGILFHSVFIGMALSVATGTPFLVLLIAISFHQTFEGLALGSRIAAITAFGPGSMKPWFMALAYGTTTPAGQLLGLLIHNLYDPYSQVGLLMVGIMNAVSSGLLLFAGLVELLAEDFLSDKSYEELRGRRRLQACASVVAGSFLMALVGAWA